MARSAGTAGSGETPRPLTDAQQRFCEEYLVDLNAARAYRVAYPKASAKSAETAGPRLFGNVQVAARVAELIAARSKRTEVDADNVIRSILRVRRRAFRSIKGDRGDLSAALGANKLLGEHLGMFTKKVEHSGKVDGMFVVPGPVTAADWARGVETQAAALRKAGVEL